jgi:hypothetical protein
MSSPLTVMIVNRSRVRTLTVASHTLALYSHFLTSPGILSRLKVLPKKLRMPKRTLLYRYRGQFIDY